MDLFQTLLPQAAPATQTGISDDQIDEMRRYAEALRTSGQQPVHHWLQGVSNVVGDVMSGLESNQADRMRAKQRQDYITALGGDAAGGAGTAPAPNSDARNTAAVLRGEPITPPAAPDAGAAPPPTDYYKRLAQVESGGNPNARSGSYSGLYQLGPTEQKIGVEGVTERNRAALAHALQREPTDAELYMAHQQGIGGALSHLANPDQPAWRSMRNTAEGQNKGDGWARQAIWGNMTPQMKAQFPGGVDTVPSGAFTQMWAQRWNNGAAPRPPADLPLPAPPKPETPLPPMRNPVMASDGALPGAPSLPEDSSDGAKPGAPPPNPITAGVLSGGAAPGATPVQAARVTPPATPPAAPAPAPAPVAGAPAQPINVSPQDQVRHTAINLIRAGMKPTEAITVAGNMAQAKAGLAGTSQRDEFGNVWMTAPGQAPRLVEYGQGKLESMTNPAGIQQHFFLNPHINPATGQITVTRFNPNAGAGGAAPPQAVPGMPAAVPSTPPQGSPSAASMPPAAPAVATPTFNIPLPPGLQPDPGRPGHALYPGDNAPDPALLAWKQHEDLVKSGEAEVTKKLAEYAPEVNSAAASRKGLEKGAELSQTALRKPMDEALEVGGAKAQNVIRVLDRMEDAYKAADASGGISGGPFKETLLNAQKGINEGFKALGLAPKFKEDELAPAEVIKKSSAELALQQIKEASSRGGTQREFIAMLDNNPGIALTDTGAKYMINILRQQAQLDQKVAKLTSTKELQENPGLWQERVVDFFNKPENRIISPFTGKPSGPEAAREDMERLKQAAQATGVTPGAPPAASLPTTLPNNTFKILPQGN